MPSLIDKYKIIFLWNRGKLWISSNTFSLYWSLLWICFKVCQKPKWNLLCGWILVQGFIMSNLTNKYKAIFPEKVRQTVKLSITFLHMLEYSVKLFWRLPKALIESLVQWNNDSRLYNAKFGKRIQNHFSGKVRESWNSLKTFFLYWSFFIWTCCYVYQKPKLNLQSHVTMVQGFIITNLVYE